MVNGCGGRKWSIPTDFNDASLSLENAEDKPSKPNPLYFLFNALDVAAGISLPVNKGGRPPKSSVPTPSGGLE